MLTIRLACLAYAEDHDGNYPSSLELLWNRDNSYLEYKVLHCPGYQGQRPGQCDYLYYGAGLVQGKEPEHYTSAKVLQSMIALRTRAMLCNFPRISKTD